MHLPPWFLSLSLHWSDQSRWVFSSIFLSDVSIQSRGTCAGWTTPDSRCCFFLWRPFKIWRTLEHACSICGYPGLFEPADCSGYFVVQVEVERANIGFCFHDRCRGCFICSGDCPQTIILSRSEFSYGSPRCEGPCAPPWLVLR